MHFSVQCCYTSWKHSSWSMHLNQKWIPSSGFLEGNFCFYQKHAEKEEEETVRRWRKGFCLDVPISWILIYHASFEVCVSACLFMCVCMCM